MDNITIGATNAVKSDITENDPNFLMLLTSNNLNFEIPDFGMRIMIKIIYRNNSFGYSGGAFTILQKLMEDVTENSYSEWMKNQILDPLGMNESHFTINPETVYKENELTWGTYSNKTTVRRRYPEYAAAGLYTSAHELTNVIKMLTNEGVYNNKTIIDAPHVDLLRRGNGAYTYGLVTTENRYYGHGGTNEGYKALLIVFPEFKDNPDGIKNAGIVIMTNGSNEDFRTYIANAIIKAYGWDIK